MKPNNHEQSKQHAFDSFCKKILKHEARDFYDELKRQRSREVSFSDLSAKQLEQLYTEDQYFATEQIFNALGLDVAVVCGKINVHTIAAQKYTTPQAA